MNPPYQLVTEKQFEGLLEKELLWLNKILKEGPQESIVPSLKVLVRPDLVTDEKPKIVVFGFESMPDYDERLVLMRKLGRQVYKEHGYPVAVMFTAEAWIKKLPRDKVKKMTKRVSEYADKQECVLSVGMSLEGGRSMAVQSIHRNTKGEIDKLTMRQYAPRARRESFDTALLNSFFQGSADASAEEGVRMTGGK